MKLSQKKELLEQNDIYKVKKGWARISSGFVIQQRYKNINEAMNAIK